MPKYTISFVCDATTAERHMHRFASDLTNGDFSDLFFSQELLEPRPKADRNAVQRMPASPRKAQTSSLTGAEVLLKHLQLQTSQLVPVKRKDLIPVLEANGFKRTYLASALDRLYQLGLAQSEKPYIALTEKGRAETAAPRSARPSKPKAPSSKTGPAMIFRALRDAPNGLTRIELAAILEKGGFRKSYIASALDALYSKNLAYHDKLNRIINLTEGGRNFNWDLQQ